MTSITKNRITFDFDGERRESYDRLAQIVCSSHWGSCIDIFGYINESHALLYEFFKHGVVVIDECEYKIAKPPSAEKFRLVKSILGKRNDHSVLSDIATLFADEPFEATATYRNTIYLPNLNAYARADGMKPEDIAEQLLSVDKIILFPYAPLDGKSAYYELSLGVEKDGFADFMKCIDERRADKMHDAIMQAYKSSRAGCRVTLRNEQKSDWKTVEQITYRAFLNTPPTGGDDGNEALLAQKLRIRPAFVPELSFVAELDGKIIGNIMYTRSKVVGDGGEWERSRAQISYIGRLALFPDSTRLWAASFL
jgi:hypothetical protein